MSCHNIGHGLNEVVRKVLVKYDAGLIPYESAFRILQQCVESVFCCDGNPYEATTCIYDRYGRCLRKGLPMFKMGILYAHWDVLDLVRKETIDYHLCQDCILWHGSTISTVFPKITKYLFVPLRPFVLLAAARTFTEEVLAY